MTITDDDIVAGVLQGDIQAPYFFIICLDYGLRNLLIKSKKIVPSSQMKESEGSLQKQLPMLTTPMT